jgi:FkbM family methyltransferase
LDAESVVIDAGAHRGQFSAEIIRRFGCKCHLVEANPALAAQLAVPGSVSVTNAALSAEDGSALLHLTENPESSSLTSNAATEANRAIEVETVTLQTLRERLGLKKIDLLKLDIEGAEFGLIETTDDDTLRGIDQITVEFHDFQPRFSGAKLFEKARARLESLGFVCAIMSFRTHGDVLFLNFASLDIPKVTQVYLHSMARLLEKAKVRLGFARL